ncbi:hypothetical protein AAEH76_01100 [Shewanella algae]|uniref:hypothetical protein n=1 Tax=Shewanella algae TaxID=38313 RepID=UPI00313E9B6F
MKLIRLTLLGIGLFSLVASPSTVFANVTAQVGKTHKQRLCLVNETEYTVPGSEIQSQINDKDFDTGLQVFIRYRGQSCAESKQTFASLSLPEPESPTMDDYRLVIQRKQAPESETKVWEYRYQQGYSKLGWQTLAKEVEAIFLSPAS